MEKTLVQKLFCLILLGLITIPCSSLANVVYSPYYDWSKIAIFSLLSFLIIFLVWILSPLGIIFIFSILAQFLVFRKTIRIVAWVFQGIVFILTLLLGIIGLLYTFSLYGEEKYILLFGFIGAITVIFCLMIGTIIAQIIWQTKKPKSSNLGEKDSK